MTTRTLLLDSPFLLGFEHTQRLIDRAARGAGDAGFSAEQLEVQVEDRQLTIAGRRPEPVDAEGRAYLHRGIAARGFQRAFVLADGMTVEGATLEHGLLHVDLAPPAEAPAPTRIAIKTAG